MASNLYEYYKATGQKMPSVGERQDVATKAGITGYVGSAEQNATLLGYLQNTPNQGANNVITSDNLSPEKPVQVKAPTDTSFEGMNSYIGSLLETTRAGITKDQADYDKQTQGLAEAMKASGDTSAFEERVIQEQGVDTSKKVRDTFMSQIEQEQKSTMDRMEALRKSFKGTTEGLNAELSRISRESANRLANYGIGLSAASRDYETASSIADRLITANTNKIKADIESRQFVLQQLGTKLATQQSNAFQLQLKQVDKEDEYYKEALGIAKDGVKDGVFDGDTAFKAISDLTSGKISLSQFYTNLGVNNDYGNINGYDITSYATDPQHEAKVQSIYDTMGEVSDATTATSTIKALSPNSPITGAMVMNASAQYKVDPKLMIAIMQQDSSLGTAGIGARNYNPGNVGQFDSLGTTPTEGYKSWQEGVDAVAKWLAGHRSSGIYRGEFQATIETVVNATQEPEVSKKRLSEQMKAYVANGDYESLYTNIENTVSKALTGDNKTKFNNDRRALKSTDAMAKKLQAYADAGGDMGLLKGTYEQIWNKLGTVADTRYKSLATDLRMALQQYRKDMSGAAFSEQEARDYASVNPAGTNNLELNLSILSGMRDNFERRVTTQVEEIAGDGAIYIREYAQTGTTPNTGAQKAAEVYNSTPSGNSYTIVQE